ncbi:MAG: hypothetical protein MRY59_03005 [Aquisalinus sp.]|nr:hypothetical protein [Aquisalinus sp.]
MSKTSIFSVGAIFFLLGCTSSTSPEERAEINSAAAETVTIAESVYLTETVDLSEADFIGQPMFRLETFLGRPAFVRQEGVGAFHRYDTEVCRIYAMTANEAGLIDRLTVSDRSGAPMRLGECL